MHRFPHSFSRRCSRPAGSVPHRFAALAATLATVGLMATTVIAPAPVSAAESRAGEIGMKALDVLVLRPGGLLRSVVGAAFLVPTSLFNLMALPTQGLEVYSESVELLVLEPFRYTFTRPLGQDIEGE